MRDNAMHHARAVYIINALHALELSFIMTSSQQQGLPLHSCACASLHDTACSGYSYMMEYTEWVQQGRAKRAPLLVMVIKMGPSKIQWNLCITDKLVQELLSVIWRCPLLGSFIIAWVGHITKIDDVI